MVFMGLPPCMMRVKIYILIFYVCFTHGENQYVPWSRLVPAKRINQVDPHLALLHHELNATVSAAWQLFKVAHNRVYTHSVEHAERFKIFALNFLKAHLHNKKYDEGRVHYQMSMNEFSDRTPDEIRRLKCLKVPPHYRARTLYTMEPDRLPESVNWRTAGAVTPVKNQGSCGSCWAFSSTGAIEGHYFLAKKSLMSFSEQQLVDCSSDFGNEGCDGGFMDNAFEYVQKSHGLNSEEEYPYVSGNTSRANPFCYFNKTLPHVRVTGYVDIPPYDEKMLMHALATKGPVSVAINAIGSFPLYHRGVYSDPDCSGDREHLNHGVLLVGYGEENGIPYWLIKNSWGSTWGEEGYVKIMRNSSNICGVATLPSYPIVEPVS